MKTYSYGLALGIVLGILIVLTNVVFPNNEPDFAPGMLITALLIGSYIIWASYHASKNAKNKSLALKVGAFTSFIGFLIAMLTFFTIDNLFLDIVSKQADKIMAFQNSNYSSMRELVNWGLARGLLFGTPASAVFGLVCGFIGSKLSPSVSRK